MKLTAKQVRENGRRAKRALNALASQGYSEGNDVETAIVDFMADVRHLCDDYGIAFGEISNRGYDHYIAEIGGED